MDDADNSSSDESMELFPIDHNREELVFKYDDPFVSTGVIRAVIEGDKEKLQDLLKAGRSININDNHGNTPVHIAVINNNVTILKFILEVKSLLVNSRNFKGETALFLAVRYQFTDIVLLMLQAGANVNLPNNEEVTPLHNASNNPEIAHLLIKNGAKLDVIDYGGDTPLNEAVSSGCLEVVCMLLYYNADANACSDHNLTPFMKALIREDIEIQRTLFNYVDDFNQRTQEGMPILALALTHETLFVEEIINRGANVNYHLDFKTPFDAFQLCLQVPDEDKFRLIWNKFVYLDYDKESILSKLCKADLSSNNFTEYLDIILSSCNLMTAIYAPEKDDDIKLLITTMVRLILPVDYINNVIYILWSYGKNVTPEDLDSMFYYFGYCELFKIGLHMDIKNIGFDENFNFLHLLYDPQLSFKSFIIILNRYIGLFDLNVMFINRMSKFMSIPQLTNIPNYNHVVPCLKDIARNVARDYIIETYNLQTSRQYMTHVNHMETSQVYKKLLSYETQLY
ncbi:unnamed protein product [Brassicogethes aeneus]|uniref:Uncharacterized protein n=1 Tax=Brassicogethes aeneus TaxID=1431903 RepID=A0A9P0AYK6_BRAAE|nr:unnamed protein product [Brassicogethes aeneus]